MIFSDELSKRTKVKFKSEIVQYIWIRNLTKIVSKESNRIRNLPPRSKIIRTNSPRRDSPFPTYIRRNDSRPGGEAANREVNCDIRRWAGLTSPAQYVFLHRNEFKLASPICW